MSRMITGAGRVRIGEDTVEVKFTVPVDKCAPEALLPDAHALATEVAALGAARAQRDGRRISCRAGCGACCRQLVPVSPAEARHLAAIVAALPPERRAEVRKRFETARVTIESAGLPARGHPGTDKAAYREFGLAYFRLGIACPFLENESCSIHPERPLVCREYQVTSPAAACAEVGSGRVRQVPVPVAVWAVFSRSASADGTLQWMPLIESLNFVDAGAGAEPDRFRTGPERVESLLRELRR